MNNWQTADLSAYGSATAAGPVSAPEPPERGHCPCADCTARNLAARSDTAVWDAAIAERAS